MASMTSKLKVFLLVLLGSVGIFGDLQTSDVIKEIFLTKQFNSSDFELILKSARESYLYLRNVEKDSNVSQKVHFVQNYGNFLLELLKEIHTKDVSVYQLFAKENLFLKGYDVNQPSQDVNVTELKANIEDLQFAAERLLIPHLNVTIESHEASEVLGLNETRFDAFLKEKLRADYSDFGYFILEVFATLIGLSWGIISTVIYYTESGTNMTTVLG